MKKYILSLLCFLALFLCLGTAASADDDGSVWDAIAALEDGNVWDAKRILIDAERRAEETVISTK